MLRIFAAITTCSGRGSKGDRKHEVDNHTIDPNI
jgi:hypothetical protein